MCPRCGDLATGADGRCDECGYQLLVKPRGERRCRQGHLIASKNALTRPDGRLPECRACHNRRERERHAKREGRDPEILTPTERMLWAQEALEADPGLQRALMFMEPGD